MTAMPGSIVTPMTYWSLNNLRGFVDTGKKSSDVFTVPYFKAHLHGHRKYAGGLDE